MASKADELFEAATALQAQGRFDEAILRLRSAIVLEPDAQHRWPALSDCLLQARREETALQVCDAGLGRSPSNAALLCAKARVLQSLSRVAEATALYWQALEAEPLGADALGGLVAQALEAGDLDEAEELSGALPRGAVRDWAAARLALGRGELARGERILRRLISGGLAREREADAQLLLGEALDAQKDYAAAFAAFAAGKAIQRAHFADRAKGRDSEIERLTRLAAWFGAADPAPWQAAPPAAADPDRAGHAFLVGFPRSGTTLLEQALAGHPRVAALEEAPTLAAPYAELMTSPEGLARLARLTPAEAAHWRAGYWREVDLRCPDARGRVLLDKAPAGTLHLPLIAKLFPGATVFFALRDPRDVVLSCFRSSFQMNALTYAFTDLTETARAYAATMTLAETYAGVLPVEPIEVRYERVVDDFEGELARLCAALGLELAPGMTDVAATAAGRTVRTPSAPQVRAGLNRLGLGRWRAYAAQLEPVLPVLAPWIERLGYGASG